MRWGRGRTRNSGNGVEHRIRVLGGVDAGPWRNSLSESPLTYFGNRFWFGKINAPEQNSTIFSEVFQKPKHGTREARPNGFRLNPPRILNANPPKMNPNPARRRAEFFRQEAGSKSEAILTHSICLIQKEFLPFFQKWYTKNVVIHLSVSWQKGLFQFSN